MTGFTAPPSDAGVIRALPCDSPCEPAAASWILAATILASSMAFIGCVAPEPENYVEEPPPRKVIIERHEAPASDAPEDFRAVTPPSSYSR